MRNKFSKNYNPRKVLILPIKNPSRELFKIINNFHNKLKIIIIDDGSKINRHYFKIIKNKVKIIRNKQNMGKGYSIKKAFGLILKKKYLNGVIIADSDGQHAVSDINKIYNFFLKNPEKFIIGQRKFMFFKTPLRNYFGNLISSLIFLFRFNIYIDTQCGLRAIPRKFIKQNLDIKANDYSFELRMLINIILNEKSSLKFLKIKTIYKKKIKSYFNPLYDSFSIIKQFIK